MYTAFASVYDRLMTGVDYQGWANFYHALMERYGIPRGKVCECACGTGSLTIPLLLGCLTGLLVSITGPNINTMLIAVNPPERRGSAFSLLKLFNDLGRGLAKATLFGPAEVAEKYGLPAGRAGPRPRRPRPDRPRGPGPPPRGLG